MKFINWLLEIIKTLIAYFSVKNRSKDEIVSDFTEFLGNKTVGLDGVEKALADAGIELGSAVLGEALGFAKKHKTSLFSMTKEEMSFVWGKIFKREGNFDEAIYKDLLKSLDDEALVAEIEANAADANKIKIRVQDKKEMLKDLKENLSTLARFALAKAISVASHGIL